MFRSGTTRCAACRAIDRQCVTCGREIRSCNRECQSCRTARHDPAEWAFMVRQYNNTRRALRLAAQIGGPVPLADYIRAATANHGRCVYCNAPATTVDHIRPLSRGGLETAANLAPACGPCNSSKSNRLLTEWRPDHVAHAVACSPAVAAEYARQLADPDHHLTDFPAAR
jgi:5-methylcytosine-specific restriction endonuclease McrA